GRGGPRGRRPGRPSADVSLGEYILAACELARPASSWCALPPSRRRRRPTPPLRSVAEARVRVDHHLEAVDSVASRLGAVLVEPCPRFSGAAEWSQFEAARVNDVVLLMAHLEPAWIEAKAVKDDTLRREAK